MRLDNAKKNRTPHNYIICIDMHTHVTLDLFTGDEWTTAAVRQTTPDWARLGVDDRGELAIGKRADIIALPVNPLDDITQMEAVSFVMKQGLVFQQ